MIHYIMFVLCFAVSPLLHAMDEKVSGMQSIFEHPINFELIKKELEDDSNKIKKYATSDHQGKIFADFYEGLIGDLSVKQKELVRDLVVDVLDSAEWKELHRWRDVIPLVPDDPGLEDKRQSFSRCWKERWVNQIIRGYYKGTEEGVATVRKSHWVKDLREFFDDVKSGKLADAKEWGEAARTAEYFRHALFYRPAQSEQMSPPQSLKKSSSANSYFGGLRRTLSLKKINSAPELGLLDSAEESKQAQRPPFSQARSGLKRNSSSPDLGAQDSVEESKPAQSASYSQDDPEEDDEEPKVLEHKASYRFLKEGTDEVKLVSNSSRSLRIFEFKFKKKNKN